MAELLEYVKRKLNITWEDEDTDKRVKEIIEAAIPDLIHKLGITDPNFDFAKAGLEKTLLGAYCLYEYNHALNEFDENYSRWIAQVRAKHAVAQHIAESEEANG